MLNVFQHINVTRERAGLFGCLTRVVLDFISVHSEEIKKPDFKWMCINKLHIKFSIKDFSQLEIIGILMWIISVFIFKAVEVSDASSVLSLIKVFSIGVSLKCCDLCMFEERVISTLLVSRMLRIDILGFSFSKCFYFVFVLRFLWL